MIAAAGLPLPACLLPQDVRQEHQLLSGIRPQPPKSTAQKRPMPKKRTLNYT